MYVLHLGGRNKETNRNSFSIMSESHPSREVAIASFEEKKILWTPFAYRSCNFFLVSPDGKREDLN